MSIFLVLRSARHFSSSLGARDQVKSAVCALHLVHDQGPKEEKEHAMVRDEKANAVRKTSARRFVIAPLSVSLLVLAGCLRIDGYESTESESTEVGAQSTALIFGCPRTGKVGIQKRVTAYVDYVLGSPTSPFVAYPCNNLLGINLLSTQAEAELVANTLRSAVALGTCTVGDPISSTVCGLPAAERVVTCLGLSGPELLVVAGAGAILDLCWGVGASGFLHSSQDGLYTYMDPEPVTTTQSLSGSNGATAAAVYRNSQTSTRVVKWYSTGIYAPNLAAGTPCSISDLPSGGTATRVILGSGSYKRCG
jgi:hypothetical protein